MAVTNTLNLYYRGEDIFSVVNCVVVIWITLVSLSGNIFNIMFIAIERTISVYFPLKSITWITTSKTKKVSFKISVNVVKY